MSEKTIHQLLLITLSFILLVLIALAVLEPVYAILWLLSCLLGFLILAFRKPQLFEGEKRRIAGIISRIKGSNNVEQVYDVTFTPDHMLVEQSTNGKTTCMINKESFVIGRNSSCDCCIRNDREVSSKHCRIIYRKYSHMYFIEDMRSSNGTYLGTRRLEPYVQEKLLDDALIVIGQHSFRFIKETKDV